MSPVQFPVLHLNPSACRLLCCWPKADTSRSKFAGESWPLLKADVRVNEIFLVDIYDVPGALIVFADVRQVPSDLL